MKFWNGDSLNIISNLNFIYNKSLIYFLLILEQKVYIIWLGIYLIGKYFLLKPETHKK